LHTTNPKALTVPLTLNAVSQDTITISPAFLHLGHVGPAPNGDGPRVVLLFKRSGTFRVRSVKSGTSALRAEVREPAGSVAGTPAAPARGGRGYYEIAVRYVGGWNTGQAAGKILIVTDDPQSSTLEIPYQAIVD
jgi:hypothetical protein